MFLVPSTGMNAFPLFIQQLSDSLKPRRTAQSQEEPTLKAARGECERLEIMNRRLRSVKYSSSG
jgi:hypothetical protein